jgi:hypothetical protein
MTGERRGGGGRACHWSAGLAGRVLRASPGSQHACAPMSVRAWVRTALHTVPCTLRTAVRCERGMRGEGNASSGGRCVRKRAREGHEKRSPGPLASVVQATGQVQHRGRRQCSQRRGEVGVEVQVPHHRGLRNDAPQPRGCHGDRGASGVVEGRRLGGCARPRRQGPAHDRQAVCPRGQERGQHLPAAVIIAAHPRRKPQPARQRRRGRGESDAPHTSPLAREPTGLQRGTGTRWGVRLCNTHRPVTHSGDTAQRAASTPEPAPLPRRSQGKAEGGRINTSHRTLSMGSAGSTAMKGSCPE